MRGFFVGSLILVAGYVLLQQGSADRVSAGSGALVGLARRFLSPGVAGVPDRSTKAASDGSTPIASGIGRAPAPGGGGGSSW